MNKKDVVLGLVVVIVISGLFLFYRRNKDNLQVPQATNGPTAEENLQKTFNIKIPDGVERAVLRDVSGGDASGVATRDTVLADLPDPEAGYFYQAWQEKDGNLISLGKMRLAKGGFLLEGRIGGSGVVISKEKVFDGNMETKLLEGSF